MKEWLQKKFPHGYNYFVAQQDAEQINQYMSRRLFLPTYDRSKQSLWGESARNLSAMGSKIGWVPNKLLAAFLAETVEMEIAEACAASEGLLQSKKKHVDYARELLAQLNLLQVAQKNPYTLSEGEVKLLWFITQWVKQPEYLIIGHLPSSLSIRRTHELLDFIWTSINNSKINKTIILGYVVCQKHWFSEFLKITNEKLTNKFRVYENFIFK
jgi:ABC-type molybdenum transport system ATPase subunit/photorepair protein PhrA